jgi:hypothetical protein
VSRGGTIDCLYAFTVRVCRLVLAVQKGGMASFRFALRVLYCAAISRPKMPSHAALRCAVMRAV